MQPLRFPWLWWAAGWLMVAGVSVGSLMPNDYLPDVSLSDKLQHAGAYCLLMLWFGGLYARERHWRIALLILAFGFALDLAQGGTATREFDLADVAANAGGILLGFVLLGFGLAGWCRRVEQLFNF